MDNQDEAELCFPQLFNMSCKKPSIPWSKAVFLHIVLPSISFLTVILNLLIIISISHFRQLHTPTNILLLSLAVSDFLVGLLLLPGEIIRNTACWFLGQLTCLLFIYLCFVITSASVGIMVLISVDRYAAICDPLHYHTRITDRRVKLCVCLCWLCSVLYSTVLIKDYMIQTGGYKSCYGECILSIDLTVGVYDFALSFIIPVSVIIVLYLRVFMVAVSHARAMHSHVTAVTLQLSVTVTVTTKKSELKAARTLGVLVLVFLMCFCPYYCVSFVGDELLNSSVSVVNYLFYINSCLNPVIYAMFYPWFRKAVKLIITLHILQSGSCEVSIL